MGVLQKDPFFLGGRKILPVDGLGEQVSVIGLPDGRVDVGGAVQALVGDLDDLALDAVAFLYVLDVPPELRLLALVSGIQRHGQRDLVAVKEKRLPDDRVLAALLRRPLPSQAVLEVDLEVVVRAVEVDLSRVPWVRPLYVVVEKLDELLVVASEVFDAVEYLVVGVGPASVDVRDCPLERLQLRARADDLGVDHGADEVGDLVLELPVRGHEAHVAVEPELVHHRLQEEVSDVELGGRLADLGLSGLLRSVELLDEPLAVAHGVLYPGIDKVRHIAELPVGAVPAAHPGSVPALVDLEILALLRRPCPL